MPETPVKYDTTINVRLTAEMRAEFLRVCALNDTDHPVLLRSMIRAAIEAQKRHGEIPRDIAITQRPWMGSRDYEIQDHPLRLAAEDPEPPPKRKTNGPPKDLPALDVDRPA